MNYIKFDRDKIEDNLMTMSDIIKDDFIKAMSDPDMNEFIDTNNFDALYRKYDRYGIIHNRLTELLLVSDIEFLPYLTRITSTCFEALPITELIIPKSVQKIGWLACYIPGLGKIKYEGTMEEWGKIKLDTDWCNDAITTIECIDGVIKL